MSDAGITFSVAAGVPVVLAGYIYAAGARRRIDVGRPVVSWRHAAFGAAIGLLFLSLEWPFSSWAHVSFFDHQLGMLVARIVAPMLIAVAHPAGLLVAGLPRPVRARLLKPGLSAAPVRLAWRTASHPAFAMACYVGALYAWNIPAAQAAALHVVAVGLLMHFSLLFAGLLFWTAIFERRPAPHGATHAARLMMIWLAVLTQIALGAYITVKTTVIYQAYVVTERQAMLSPIAEERRGGAIIWIVSGLLSLLALITVIDMWGRHETKMDARRTRWSPSNSAILLYPTTGRELRAMAEPRNRGLAIALAAFVLVIFASMCSYVVGAHHLNRRENLRLYALSRQ